MNGKARPAQIWSDYRKWMSNIVPLVVCVPFALAAYFFDVRGNELYSIVSWCLVPIALWLGINYLALFQNNRLKGLMLAKLQAVAPDQVGKAWFVGFSRPSVSSGIHLHEDIGWLYLDADRVHFLGESSQYEMARDNIRKVRFGANWNSILGLGRWIIIEGVEGNKRLQLRVELREKSSLLANRSFGKQVLRRIADWRKTGR